MNQFRDILIALLLLLAISIGLGHPEDWTWPASGGPAVVNAVYVLAEGRPWTVIIMVGLALALFMTRLKY